MHSNLRVSGLLASIALFAGCPKEGGPPDQPKVEDKAAQPATPSSQPSSQPGSMPKEHNTSTVPVTLQDLFKMPQTPDDVVIKVGATELRRGDLEAKLRELQIQLGAVGLPAQITRKEVLSAAVEQLIEIELRRQFAKELGVKVDPKEVAAWVKNEEEKMERDPAYKAFLAQAGNTHEQRMRDGEILLLGDGVLAKLTEDLRTRTSTTLKAYYERNKKDFIEREGVEVWRIFVKAPAGIAERDRDVAKSRAEEIYKEASKHPDRFETIAMTRSEGGSVANKGYIGYVSRGTLAKDIEDKIFAAKTGAVLPLHEDASGFYIYKTGKHRGERARSYEEVKDEIFARLYRPMLNEQLDKELKKLRDKREIKVLIPELNS
jgi:parvulin-like peptidyl-prolyl isomerase